MPYQDQIIRDFKKSEQMKSPVEEDTNAGKDHAVAGDYKMTTCVMLSTNTSTPIDMLPIVDNVIIYEDISKPYLLCDIAVRDGMGFRELAPLVGEEFVAVEAITKGFPSSGGTTFIPDLENNPNNIGMPETHELDNKVSKIFRVDSVSPIGNVNDRYKIYVIHCISLEAIISEKKKISMGYPIDKNIGDIVKEIYRKNIVGPLRNHYSTEMIPIQNLRKFFKPKQLRIEPTEGYFRFCFPFKSPFDIITSLAEKAEAAPPVIAEDDVDPEDDGPTDGAFYMFYETLTCFKFESLESCFKRKPKRTFFSEVIVSTNPEEDDKFMARGLPVQQFNNVEDFSIDSLFNVIANLREGMYASKLITHDITRMRYDLIGYRYFGLKKEIMDAYNVVLSADPNVDTEAFEQAKKKLMDFTRSLGEGKLCSPRHDCLLDDGGEGSRIRLTGTDFNHDYYFNQNRKADGQGTNTKPAGAEPGLKPANLERRVQKRDSQLQQLDNIKLTIKINGDSSLRVGDIIEMKVPSTIENADNPVDYDTWLAGKYMMTKIKHVFSDERYTQEIQIRKDGYSRHLPASEELSDMIASADNEVVTTKQALGELDEKDAQIIPKLGGKQITPGDATDQASMDANLNGGPFYDMEDNIIPNNQLGANGLPNGTEGYQWGRTKGYLDLNPEAGVTEENVNRNL